MVGNNLKSLEASCTISYRMFAWAPFLFPVARKIAVRRDSTGRKLDAVAHKGLEDAKYMAHARCPALLHTIIFLLTTFVLFFLVFPNCYLLLITLYSKIVNILL